MKSLRTIVAASAFAAMAFATAPAAFAGDPVIDAAIAAGEVGETIDGLLGVVGTADPAVVRKVNEINNRRAAKYAEVAADTGTTPAQVARLTGEKQIAKLQAGEYYMDESGVWKRK
ncbi:MAG: YdbL family protein [Hyphomonas sp.]|nr:YdbL family protein [Hyphomonas sp.]HRX73059.1 YdbL family protein [Hyphomonas sp.]